MGQRPPGPGSNSFPSGVMGRCGIARPEQEVFLKHRRISTRRRSLELQFVTASVCAVQDKATGHVFAMYGTTPLPRIRNLACQDHERSDT